VLSETKISTNGTINQKYYNDEQKLIQEIQTSKQLGPDNLPVTTEDYKQYKSQDGQLEGHQIKTTSATNVIYEQRDSNDVLTSKTTTNLNKWGAISHRWNFRQSTQKVIYDETVGYEEAGT
jgi:hypothetical protein